MGLFIMWLIKLRYRRYRRMGVNPWLASGLWPPD